MTYSLELCWEKDADSEGFYSLSGAYCTSIEGFASEWNAIADGLRKRETVGFKRASFRWDKEGQWFEACSPRNSYGRDDSALVMHEEIDELADEIDRILKANGERCVFADFDPIAAGA